MKKLYKNLAFYESCSDGWTFIPARSNFFNTFFSTPAFASERTITAYGKDALLRIVKSLRTQAQRLAGIDSFQELYDMTNKLPSLLLIEEGDQGDRGACVIPDREKALRVIIIFWDEYYSYSLRGGWECTGMRRLY